MATKDLADVLLIGSGASGGPFAWYLSQVPGIKIVCLEQGDWDQQWAGKESEEHWYRLVKPSPQPGANYFANGYPYDHTESSWQPILGHNVGGAAVHWGGGFSRLHPSDFILHSLTGVGDDWPIRYGDLAPYYDLNYNTVGVSGVPGNPAFPPMAVDFQPAPALGKAVELFRRGCDKLGWHYWPGTRAWITVPFKGRNPKNPREAKNRPDIVHWPEAIRNGVVLKARATVREITINKRGLADGALYYDADGRLHEQKARIVVVACNGIGTPRLLLNSKSARFSQGLANSSGMVGKCLMAHPMARLVFLIENEDASLDGGRSGLSSDEFYDPKPARGFIGGFSLSGGSFSGPIGAALGTPPESLVTMIPASLEPGPIRTGNALAWGRTHHAAFQQRYRRTTSISISTSELPEEANRVELHPTLTDDFGTPAPKLIYRRSENTDKLVAFALERATQLAEAMGATRIMSSEAYHSSWRGAAPGHYMGTARMGSDPKRSVVDQWGRAHDVRNLFIIDGSVFTTSGAGGPTATIQAIALRTADYLKTNAKKMLTS